MLLSDRELTRKGMAAFLSAFSFLLHSHSFRSSFHTARHRPWRLLGAHLSPHPGSAVLAVGLSRDSESPLPTAPSTRTAALRAERTGPAQQPTVSFPVAATPQEAARRRQVAQQGSMNMNPFPFFKCNSALWEGAYFLAAVSRWFFRPSSHWVSGDIWHCARFPLLRSVLCVGFLVASSPLEDFYFSCSFSASHLFFREHWYPQGCLHYPLLPHDLIQTWTTAS